MIMIIDYDDNLIRNYHLFTYQTPKMSVYKTWVLWFGVYQLCFAPYILICHIFQFSLNGAKAKRWWNSHQLLWFPFVSVSTKSVYFEREIETLFFFCIWWISQVLHQPYSGSVSSFHSLFLLNTSINEGPPAMVLLICISSLCFFFWWFISPKFESLVGVSIIEKKRSGCYVDACILVLCS